MKTALPIILAAALVFGCSTSDNEAGTGPNAGLIGSWTWSKYTYHGKDTSFVWADLNGQAIFTKKSYSLIYVNQLGPRSKTRAVRFDSLSNSELLNSIGKVVANSGSYEVVGDSIITQREVSLWPNVMHGNKRLALPMPARITKDSLIWHTDAYDNVWLRKK